MNTQNMNQQLQSNFGNKNYYDILGVSRNATMDEITQVYKRMSMRFHPNQYKDPNQRISADSTFQNVSDAYQALSDVERRVR